MTEQAWYSASLLVAVINERGGLWKRVTSVVLVRADDFEAAFRAACEVGRGMEETYLNRDEERVRWAFERVATLDLLPERLMSGTEVYSAPHDAESPTELAFDAQFHPERFPPGQAGVPST